MSSGRRQNRKKTDRRRPGVFLAAGWLFVLLAAMSLVTWRQATGVEMESALRTVETERGIAEAERVAAVRRIEELQSRARILRVASERLGMRLPEESEIVFLPVDDPIGSVTP